MSSLYKMKNLDLDMCLAQHIESKPALLVGEDLQIAFNSFFVSLTGEDWRALYHSPGKCWIAVFNYEDGDKMEWHPIPFSTDLSAAWFLIDEIHKEGCFLVEAARAADANFEWSVTFNGETFAYGPNAPAAIARAAYCVIGPKVKVT